MQCFPRLKRLFTSPFYDDDDSRTPRPSVTQPRVSYTQLNEDVESDDEETGIEFEFNRSKRMSVIPETLSVHEALEELDNPTPIPLAPIRLRLNPALALEVKPRQPSIHVAGKQVPTTTHFEKEAIEAQPHKSKLSNKGLFNNSVGTDMKPRKVSTFLGK